MAKFTPEEWTQDKDLIWAGYLNAKDVTHAMLAQFWDNDEATAEEAAAYVLRACQSYASMLAILEKALPIIEEEAERRSMAMQGDSDRIYTAGEYWSEMRELANEIQAEIDRARGKEDQQHG